MKTLLELRKEKLKHHPAIKSGYFDSELKVKPPQSAAQLEKLIDEYCSLSGAECVKVYSGGRQLVKKTNVIDVMGRSNTITDSKFIPGTTRAGTSDLIIIKNNRALFVEVKYSRSDRQNENQKKFEERQIAFGNTYVIVKSLDEFIEVFNWYYL